MHFFLAQLKQQQNYNFQSTTWFTLIWEHCAHRTSPAPATASPPSRVVPHQAQVSVETNQEYLHRVTPLIKPQGRKANMSSIKSLSSYLPPRTSAEIFKWDHHWEEAMGFLNKVVEDTEWNAPRAGWAQLGIWNDEDWHYYPDLCQETEQRKGDMHAAQVR